MTRPSVPQLSRDERGATIVEFALIAPVFFLMLMGVFDIGYQVYISAALNGEIQKAARDSALETGSARLTVLDDAVKAQVRRLAPNAQIDISRTAYRGYKDVGRGEAFSDGNANGKCDNNEPYTDENDNSVWDASLGKEGIGGARDVVQYNIKVTYDQLFPLWKMLGSSQYRTIDSTTILKNQPYSDQGSAVSVARTCS